MRLLGLYLRALGSLPLVFRRLFLVHRFLSARWSPYCLRQSEMVRYESSAWKHDGASEVPHGRAFLASRWDFSLTVHPIDLLSKY
jgi:hypothetical protein